MKENAAAAAETMLRLIAEVTDEAFEALGEGVILGTMPEYLQRFGQDNAKYLAKHFVDCNAAAGATSALTPMNFVSRVLGTEFEMVEQSKHRATKRLLGCEFASTFGKRDEFPRAMICMLHQASYQGSVNAGLDETTYDVEVKSRILFGDEHCDFVVTRRDQLEGEDHECPTKAMPGAEQRQGLSYEFYTYILAAFVDYLSSQLSEEHVREILQRAANRVGAKLPNVMKAAGIEYANYAVAAILTLGGRTLDGTRVTACPQQAPIEAASRHRSPEAQLRSRMHACSLCKNVVASAAAAVDPNATVRRTSCLTAGDPDCNFEVDS